MREQLRLPTPVFALSRITPAHAGTTRIPLTCTYIYRDHPRLCGNNAWSRPPRVRYQGSPPHMREQHRSVVKACFIFRITPACAGTTWFRVQIFPIRYGSPPPRSCGNNRVKALTLGLPKGSPPQVRE